MIASFENKVKLKSKVSVKKFENILYDRLSIWRDNLENNFVEECPGIPDVLFENSTDVIKFPPNLNSAERRAVHNVATRLQIFHASCGVGSDRYVFISKTKKSLDELNTSSELKSCWYNPTIPKVKHLPISTSFDITEMKILRVYLENIAFSSLSYYINLKGPSDLSHMNSIESIQYRLIDNIDSLNSMIQNLTSCYVIGFDTEMHYYRSYYGITCIIQISTCEYNYIIDCYTLWDHIPNALSPIFGSPNILKIGHGIEGGDIPSLFRDFGIIIVNVFDTQIASSILGISATNINSYNTNIIPNNNNNQNEEIILNDDGNNINDDNDDLDIDELKNINIKKNTQGVGLTSLLKYYNCPLHNIITEKKKEMKSFDWRLRPMTTDMLLYTATDVHFLIPLYNLLARQLLLSNGVPSGGFYELQKKLKLQLEEFHDASSSPNTTRLLSPIRREESYMEESFTEVSVVIIFLYV
jgi:hypothetical protein